MHTDLVFYFQTIYKFRCAEDKYQMVLLYNQYDCYSNTCEYQSGNKSFNTVLLLML